MSQTQRQKQNLNAFLIILVLIGAINWGLIGMFNYNAVHEILMGNTMAKKVVYSIIGISAVYLAFIQQIYSQKNSVAVFPTHLLYHCVPPSKGKKINIQTKYPNTSIIYWTDKDGQLVNTGTSSTNKFGGTTVILTGSKEQKNDGYIILPREVYFRAVLDSATLSKVETAKI